MKRIITLSFISLCALVSYSQESVISLNTGYISSIERGIQTGNGNGWRLIGTYQKSLKNEKWAMGISAGLMEDRYKVKYSDSFEETNVLRSVPIYISGKYFVGKKDWKGYLKGSGGLNLLLNSKPLNPVGFYTGLGLGVDYHINDKLLINTEYECNLWQNSFYGIRYFNSINIGIGFKF